MKMIMKDITTNGCEGAMIGYREGTATYFRIYREKDGRKSIVSFSVSKNIEELLQRGKEDIDALVAGMLKEVK